MSESPENPDAAPSVRIELFGAPRIVVDGRSEALKPGKKALALLALLVGRRGDPLSREQLAALLWPDRFEEQARGSLRQALLALRKLLGEAAVRGSTDGLVALAPEVATDVADFDRLRRADDLESLAAAAALYRGDFLEQLDGVGDELDAWASRERERLRAQAVEVLERVVAQSSARGRLEEALAAAERLVGVDPAHEPGHRALMSAYAALGRKAAALRQFEICTQELARRLDAAPDAETLALAEAIRNAAGDDVVVIASAPSPSPPSPGDTSAAGRSFPLLRLLRRRRLLLGAGLAALLSLIVWLPRTLVSPAAPSPEPPSTGLGRRDEASCADLAAATAAEPALVVLPLRTFGEEPAVALFAAAAMDRTQSVLALIPGVAIIAGPPPGHPDMALSLREMAAKTGATHALEGSVRAGGTQALLTLRLTDAGSGRLLWQSTTRLKLPLADPVGAQDEIALEAAGGVREHLTDGRQALVYPDYEAVSLEVWEANTRGFADLGRVDPLANARARAAFEDALAIHAENAGARTGLAYTFLSPVLFRWTSDVAGSVAAAREHAEAALAIDPGFPAASSAMALVALLEGDHAAAIELGERAVHMSGGGGDASAVLAYVLSYTDETARGVELARQAIRSRPYASPLWYDWNLAHALRLDGDLDAAVTCLSAIVENYPVAAAPTLELVLAHAARDEAEKASALADAARAQMPESFSSAGFCAAPPFTDERRTAACTAALRSAGLPE